MVDGGPRCRCQRQDRRIPGHRQRWAYAETCLRRSRRTPRRQLRRRTCLRRGGGVSSHKVAHIAVDTDLMEIMDTQDRRSPP